MDETTAAPVTTVPTVPPSPTPPTRIDDLVECENSIGERASTEEIIEEETAQEPVLNVGR